MNLRAALLIATGVLLAATSALGATEPPEEGDAPEDDTEVEVAPLRPVEAIETGGVIELSNRRADPELRERAAPPDAPRLEAPRSAKPSAPSPASTRVTDADARTSSRERFRDVLLMALSLLCLALLAIVVLQRRALRKLEREAELERALAVQAPERPAPGQERAPAGEAGLAEAELAAALSKGSASANERQWQSQPPLSRPKG